MMKMLCTRVMRKLLAQDTVFRCVSGFFRSVLPYNPQVVAQAYRDLSACSPDPGYSALRQNQVETAPPYDVQIVIPAYNAEAFIAGCLDSVLRLDTAFRIWIVVVNDGSTDRTGEILQQYAGDSRVQIMNQENRGFSGARNRGLQSIRARYVLFLDADDELLDLDSLVCRADETHADITEGGYVTFGVSGNQQTFRHEKCVGKDAVRQFYGYPWGKLFRAEFFERISFPEGYWFEDSIMSLLLFPMCKVGATTDTLVYRYRLNPNGITAKSRCSAKIVDCFWVTARLLDDHKQLGLPFDEDFARVMLIEIRINALRLMELNRRKLEQDVFLLTIALWEQFFASDCCASHPLVRALRQRDFGLYRLACWR